MMRHLIVLALTGLLVACTTQGDGGTAGSLEAEPSVAAESAAASGSAAASEAGSAACNDAFAGLADQEIASMSDLGDVEADLVEPTIENCETVADWVAGAQQVLDEVNPNTAAFFLRIRCEDQSLARTPLCEELASS